MKNKYNIGDIVYDFRIDDDDNYTIRKYIVTSYYHNTKDFIYECIGIDSNILTSNSIESSIYTKDEVDSAAIKALHRIQKANDDFRCPISGGKIIARKEPLFYHEYDAPSYYDVEGSNITWVSYPRDWKIGVYHHNGRIFDYLGEGRWQELFESKNEHTGRSIYTDLSDKQEIEDFLAERPIKRHINRPIENPVSEFFTGNSILPISTRILASMTSEELVEVKPMPLPSSNLQYIDFGGVNKYINASLLGEGNIKLDENDLPKYLTDGKYIIGEREFVIL